MGMWKYAVAGTHFHVFGSIPRDRISVLYTRNHDISPQSAFPIAERLVRLVKPFLFKCLFGVRIPL